MLGKVSGYYNAIRGKVSSGILGHRRPGEVYNNYTSRYDIEVNPVRNKFDFTNKLSLN